MKTCMTISDEKDRYDILVKLGGREDLPAVRVNARNSKLCHSNTYTF